MKLQRTVALVCTVALLATQAFAQQAAPAHSETSNRASGL
jgi:hypothetical protein